MKLIQELFPLVYIIVQRIAQRNGRAFLVGGAVRDYVLGLPIKDIDIEVHDMTPDQLELLLSEHGPVSTVGKSFGVFRLHGIDADWSLPRRDSVGRKPVVEIDPHMSLEEAARRRDLTMNAMAIDILSDTLIDPFGGVEDIKSKILRSPDITLFADDPLRFFRVMQFISRFEMIPNQELNDACKTIDVTAISRERIEEEFSKLFLFSQRPSLGLRWLAEIGRLHDVLPELSDTIGVEQNPVWHPEGDVFEHTMQTVDAAAIIAQKYDTDFKKLVLLYAGLCHDLGKATTTTYEKNVIKSIGHEVESHRLSKIMMRRITHNGDLIAAVSSLVLYHMDPLQFVKNHAKLPAYKRLANKLNRLISMNFLADLSLADKQGRNPVGNYPLSRDNEEVIEFIARSKKAGVFDRPEAPILTGSDVLGLIEPGPEMGKVLDAAYKIQINENIHDKRILLKRVLDK